MEILLIYFFQVIAIIAAIFVVNARNPIHSVFALILVFINAGVLIILLGFDFLGIIFILVYVGAIMVLFLFIIMMLNIKIIELKNNILNYLPLSAFVTLIVTLQFVYIIFKVYPAENFLLVSVLFPDMSYTEIIAYLDRKNTFITFGLLLFNFYPLSFVLISFILLIALLGSIILTLEEHSLIKRQVILEQNSRNFFKTVRRL
jgi:NADH-quinone oxidoreductase subunit J